MVDYIETLYVVAVERDLDVAKQPAFNETYVVHVCQECSAVVRDTAAHDRWHVLFQEINDWRNETTRYWCPSAGEESV